jgi:predicted transcriptional regulator
MTEPGERRKRVVLYVEMEADLKERLATLAKKRFRKISAEATIAIERYLREEEAKEAEEEKSKRKGK